MAQNDTKNLAGPQKGSGTAERRNAERVPFSAVAQLTEPKSQARMSVRIADISLKGCYADALSTMPVGTKVSLLIDHGSAQLQTAARVTYSLPGMGMGLSFDTLSPEMESILARWIAEVRGELSPTPEALEVSAAPKKPPRNDRQILGRLIQLMIRKNLISQTEGADLLEELSQE